MKQDIRKKSLPEVEKSKKIEVSKSQENNMVINITKNLIKMNLNFDDILKYTGLSIEEIQKLK